VEEPDTLKVATMPDVKTPPTFAELMDRAVLTPAKRMELALLASFDPIAAGIKIGGIIAGQQHACRMAADDDAPEEALNG
jgi:hypothetical protein